MISGLLETSYRTVLNVVYRYRSVLYRYSMQLLCTVYRVVVPYEYRYRYRSVDRYVHTGIPVEAYRYRYVRYTVSFHSKICASVYFGLEDFSNCDIVLEL